MVESKYVTAIEAISWIAFGDFHSLGKFLEDRTDDAEAQQKVARAQTEFLDILSTGKSELIGHYRGSWPENRPALISAGDGYWIIPLSLLSAISKAKGLYADFDLIDNKLFADDNWAELRILRKEVSDWKIDAIKSDSLNSNITDEQISASYNAKFPRGVDRTEGTKYLKKLYPSVKIDILRKIVADANRAAGRGRGRPKSKLE